MAWAFVIRTRVNPIFRYIYHPTLRLLAAIFPHKERTWFFKVVGPIVEVEANKEAFDRFIRSVHFTGKAEPPLTWTVAVLVLVKVPGPLAMPRVMELLLSPATRLP